MSKQKSSTYVDLDAVNTAEDSPNVPKGSTFVDLDKGIKQSSEHQNPAFGNYTGRQGSTSQYDKYLTVGSESNLGAIRAINQPWTHEFGNALGQIALNTIPTIVGNVASILDFEDYYNQDNEIGNSITRAMEEIKQNVSQDVAPIYQQNPNATMDLGNSEWWNRAFADTGTSAAAFVGTGLITGGAFGAVGRVLSASTKLAQYGQAGQAAATVLNAVALNQAESIPIAMNVYDDIYKQGVASGLDETAARDKAADAGAYSINMNRANVLLNITSSGMFIKNPAMTRKLVNQVALKNTMKTLGVEGLQEATEEVINLGAEATAKEYGKASVEGREYNNAIQDFTNAVFSKQGLESAFLGALGGMAQQGASIASKAIQGDYKAQQEQFGKQQMYLADLDKAQASNDGITSNRFMDSLSRTSEFSKKYQDAIDKNDLNGAEAVSNESLNDQAFEAYSLGTTEKLEDYYKKVKELPEEQAVQKGLDTKPDSPFYYKKRSQDALNTIKENEGLYSAYANQYGYSEDLTRTVFNNRTQAKFNIKKRGEALAKLSQLESQLDTEVKAAGLDLEADKEGIKMMPSYNEVNTVKEQIKALDSTIKSISEDYKEITSPEAIKLAKEKAKEDKEKFKAKTTPKTEAAKTEVPKGEEAGEAISQKDYDNFVENRVVSDDIVESIGAKLREGTPFEQLSIREQDIAYNTPELKPLVDTIHAKQQETEASIPTKINNKMIKDLSGLGYSKEDISNMNPIEAQNVITNKQSKPTETTLNEAVVNEETKDKIENGELELDSTTLQVKMNPRPTYFVKGVMTSPQGQHAKAYPEFAKGRKILLKVNKSPEVKVGINDIAFKDNKEYTPDTLPIIVSIKGEDKKYYRFSNIASEDSKMKHQEKELRAKLWNSLVENPSDKGPRTVTLKHPEFKVVLEKKFKTNESKDFEFTLDSILKNSPENVESKEGKPSIVIVKDGKGKKYTGGSFINVTFKDKTKNGIYFVSINPNTNLDLEELKYSGETEELIYKLESGEDVTKKLKSKVYSKEPFMVTSFFIENNFDNPPIVNGKIIYGVQGESFKIGTGTEVKPINTATEIQWIKEHLPADIPVEVVEDIQVIGSHGGEQAWGLFKDAAIYLTEKAGEGTGYHEAFHAVFRLMLDDSKIQSVINEAKSNYPKLKSASDLEVEEFLADKFAEYVINNQETKVKGTGIKAFFERIWNWAKSLVNNSEIDKLFKNIERKKFVNPGLKRATNRFTNQNPDYPVYKKIVPELTLDQEQRRFNNVHYLFTQSILEEDRVKNPDNTDSANIIYNEMDSKEKLEFYRKAYDKLQEVSKDLPEDSKSQAKVLGENFEKFVTEHEGYMQAFNEGILSPDIHQYLSELYQHVKDENGNDIEATDELGLPIYEDFDKNFNVLYTALKDTIDINKVVEIINDLKAEHPQFQKIVKDLISDGSRLNKWAFLQSFSGNTGKLQASTYRAESTIETPYKEYKEAFKAQGNIELNALKNGEPAQLEFFQNASNKLITAFANAGYTVNVNSDTALDSRGKISIDNKTKSATITLGKNANYNTLTEEFSHLYLAALGYDSPLMREGIRSAKKYRPELWKQIQETYKDEPIEVQEEELIVKLMAEEGTKILNSPAPSPLKYWINKIIRAISEFLGMPINSARYLFEDMLDGKINGVNVRRGTDIRFDKELKVGKNDELSELADTLEKYKKALSARIDAISKISGNTALKDSKLKTLKGLKKNLAKLNQEEQFVKIINFANKDLDKVIDEFKGYEDKLGSVEYAQFVHDNNSYLNSFKILSAPVGSYENNHKLRKTVDKINTKINKLVQLNKRGVYAQIEALVKEYSTNPELIDDEAIRKLVEGTIDISTFQYQLGALASSEDPLLALADKRLKLQKQKTHAFNLKLKEDLVRHRQNLYAATGSHEQTWLDQKDFKGLPTGDTVKRIGYAYNQEKRRLRESIEKDGKRMEYIEDPKTEKDFQYNKELAEKNQVINDFYNPDVTNNHVYSTEFIEEREHFESPNGEPSENAIESHHIDENGKEEIEFTPEYLAYREKYYNNFGETLQPSVDENGQFTGDVEMQPLYMVKAEYKEATDKWVDKDWQAIQNDPTKKEFYEFYIQTMEQAIDKIPTGAMTLGSKPSIFKSGAEILVDSPDKLQTFGSMCLDFLKFENKKEGLNGKKQVPLHFTSKVRNESLVAELKEKLSKLNPDTDKAQYDAVSERLKGLESRRKASDTSSDYFHIIEQFATMAENYKNLQEIEGTLNIIKDVVENRKIYQKDSKGNMIYEDEAKTIPKYIDGKLSKAAMRYRDWLEAVYYETPLDEGKIGVIADKFKKYASLRGLGLNAFSGINNLLMGDIQQGIEAWGGQFYNVKQYTRASKEFGNFMAKEMFPHLANEKALYTGKHSSKLMAAMETFDVLQDTSEMNRTASGEKKILQQVLGMNWMFAMLNIGEFANQSRSFISIALNTPITSSTGKESNVWDAMELVDGKLQFKEGFEMSSHEIALLSEKIRGINQFIHGKYTKEDASRLQRYWLGKLAMQFRAWMGSAIDARFRGKYYDERISTSLRGRYLSLGTLASEIEKYSGNVLKAWSNMSDLDKMNNKKNLAEMCYFLTAVAGAQLLASLAADIPEEDVLLKKTVNFLHYQDKRLQSELSQFMNPVSTWEMIKNPLASVDVLKQGNKFLIELVKAPYDLTIGDSEDLYYSNGKNEGRTKVFVEGVKTIPIVNQVEKWWGLTDQNNEYHIQ